MSLRVNLLRPEEFRQPGMMNPKVIMRIAIFGGSGIALLTIVLVLLQVGTVKRSLSVSRSRLKEIDPRFQDCRAMQQDLTIDQGLYEELQGWHAGRFSWEDLLLEIQNVVPEQVQLTRLTIHGSMTMIHPPAWKKKAKSHPARRFKMRLDGRAAGERGNEVVVQFVRTLRAAPDFEPILNEVKLATGLKRSQTREDREPDWTFGIEASSRARKMLAQEEPKPGAEAKK